MISVKHAIYYLFYANLFLLICHGYIILAYKIGLIADYEVYLLILKLKFLIYYFVCEY